MIETGTVIANRYRILREIGRGGMSIVYLADDIRLDKQWAIKESRKSDSSTISSVISSSLITEVNMLKRLRHPALPQIVDIIDNGDSVAIVMDYVEGESLNALVNREGPQGEEHVTEWAIQLCDVLSYLHNQLPRPVIYRDMKPANVMLRPDDTVAILDLGIAREFKEFNTNDTTVLGTRGYAPPEQYCGQTDARSDIYALGMTMRHLLTGVAPHFLDTSAPLHQHGVTLSKEMDAIIKKCIQPAAENRYQSCQELCDDLLKLRKILEKQRRAKEKELTRQNKSKQTSKESKTMKEKRVKTSSRSKAPAIIAVALVFVLALGFVGFSWLRNHNKIEDYEKLINISVAEDIGTKIDCYKDAIELYPERTEAYIKILDAYENEGQFDKAESDEFLALYYKYQFGFNTTTKETAELNYKAGTMYFNYFTVNGEAKFSTRVNKSYGFFAANYENQQISPDFAQKSLSDCYYQICTFYKKYILSSATAEEASRNDYEALFRTIEAALNDVEGAGAYDQLTLYNGTFMLLYDQRFQMASMGVDEATVTELLNTVYNSARSLSVQKEQSKKLQQEIVDNYATYLEAIERAYDAGVHK